VWIYDELYITLDTLVVVDMVVWPMVVSHLLRTRQETSFF